MSIPKKARRIERLDIGPLQPAKVRDDGTIRAEAHLTRCGIFKYVQPDGSVHYELREPEQVFDPESVESFNGVPMTNEHPPVMLDASNAKQYAIGSLQGTPTRDDDHLRGRMSIFDGEAIADMRHGRRQVSLGYICDLDETPGVHPVYGKYDARQLNIRGNHCALVDNARAGASAAVRLDAAPRPSAGCVRLDAAEMVDEWSEEAREAAAEARKAGAKGKTEPEEKSKPEGKAKAKTKGLKSEVTGKEADEMVAAVGRLIAAGHGSAGTSQHEGEHGAFGTDPDSLVDAADVPTKNKKRGDAWSDEAREAAAEARKAEGAKDPKTGLSKGEHAFARAVLQSKGDPKRLEKLTGHKASDLEPLAQSLRQKLGVAKGATLAEHLSGMSKTGAFGDKPSGETAEAQKTWIALRAARAKKDAGISGMALASRKDCAINLDMADKDAKPQGGKPSEGDPDPKDVASRNAKGEDDADPKKKGEAATGAEQESARDDSKRQAGQGGEDDDPEDPDFDDDDDDADDEDDDDSDAGGDDDDDADRDDDDSDTGDTDTDKEDAYDASYDDAGKLTDEARRKIATSNFAVPEREGLPIHDKEHCQAAMKGRFANFDFKSPDEKHAAFNRITKRSKQFGASTDEFERVNKPTLDRADSATTPEDKKMSEKTIKLRAALAAAKKRADAAEGRADSLQKDLETAKTRTDASDELAKKVEAQVGLLADARATGAKVDAKMSAVEIKRAVVKHVDSVDIDPKKSEDYVDAYYENSLKRAKIDAEEVHSGAAAIAAARARALVPVAHADAEECDEEALAAASLTRSQRAWERPAPMANRRARADAAALIAAHQFTDDTDSE